MADENMVATTPAPIEHSPTQLDGDQGQKGPQNPQAQLDGWKQAAQNANPQTENVSPTSQIPSQPAPPLPPVVITPVQRPGILGVVDKMADVLAGKTRPEMATDQQGNKYVKETTLSRGEQWMKVAGHALQGAAEGLKAGRGGNIGGAAAAGVEAGEKNIQRGEQQQKDLTGEARQQNLDNANNQMLRMQMYESGLRARRLEVEGSEHDIKFAQDEEDRYTKAGGQVLAHVQTLGDISKVLQADPDAVQNMIEKHQIEIVPHYSAAGKADGVNVIKMPDSYRKAMIPAGAAFSTFDSTTGKYVEHHASDPMTQGEIDDLNHKAAIDSLDFKSKQAELAQKAATTASANATASEAPSKIALNKAETAKNYADADHAKAEAELLNNTSDPQTIQSNAQQMVEGQIDPSNLSKRAKTYDATLAAANQYSLQKYGRPFDPAKASGDYKFATSPNTYNTLNYLNSLTGRDDKGGNLQALINLSKQVPRGEYPPLNAIDQWAKLSSGNVKVAEFRAALLEVSDQVAKILQGGGAGGGGTSDAKIKQASEVLNKNFSNEQLEGVANNSLRPLLANRKKEIIGDNRYLQQWHGGGPPPAQQQASQRPTRPTNVPGNFLFVKTTAQDPGQWIDPTKLEQAKQMAPALTVVQ